MSQIKEYHTPASIQPLSVSTNAVTTTILTSGQHSLRVNEVFVMERPVEVVNDEIIVNENLMIEDNFYPIYYQGQNYYMRRSKGITELFKLEELESEE